MVSIAVTLFVFLVITTSPLAWVLVNIGGIYSYTSLLNLSKPSKKTRGSPGGGTPGTAHLKQKQSEFVLAIVYFCSLCFTTKRMCFLTVSYSYMFCWKKHVSRGGEGVPGGEGRSRPLPLGYKRTGRDGRTGFTKNNIEFTSFLHVCF